MKEIPKPESLAGVADAGLHQEPHKYTWASRKTFVLPRSASALVVQGLNEILARCEAADLPARPDSEIDGRRRVHVFDPFGNHLELIEAMDK